MEQVQLHSYEHIYTGTSDMHCECSGIDWWYTYPNSSLAMARMVEVLPVPGGP
jgi:hypothetical protein